MSMFPKTLTAFALFSILALSAWAQSQPAAHTPPAPGTPGDIALDRADFSKARGQYEADKAHALAVKHKLQADMKQYGANSPQVAQDRQELQNAKMTMERDRNIMKNERQDIRADRAHNRARRRGL